MEYNNQMDMAMQSLMAIQNVMGELGFILNGDNTYYKDYALMDGSIMRLTPVFDRGTSMNVDYRLVGFNINTMKFVSITNGTLESPNAVPRDCTGDVSRIIETVGFLEKKPQTESFIVVVPCSDCGNEVNSYLQFGTKFRCLKCVGYSND